MRFGGWERISWVKIDRKEGDGVGWEWVEESVLGRGLYVGRVGG